MELSLTLHYNRRVIWWDFCRYPCNFPGSFVYQYFVFATIMKFFYIPSSRKCKWISPAHILSIYMFCTYMLFVYNFLIMCFIHFGRRFVISSVICSGMPLGLLIIIDEILAFVLCIDDRAKKILWKFFDSSFEYFIAIVHTWILPPSFVSLRGDCVFFSVASSKNTNWDYAGKRG